MSSFPGVACLALALILVGCGGTPEPVGDARDRPPPPLVVPDRAACAADRLATRRHPDERAPRAGTYRYRVAGTQRVRGDAAKPLRRDMIVEITPARRIGNVLCYRARRTLLRGVSETATLAVRGNRAYITEIESTLGGLHTRFTPNPPVLALDPDLLSWEGTFVGTTSGRYKAEYLGRRRFKVGGRSVRAAGGRLRLASTGEQVGSQRSTQWVDPHSRIVVREVVEQRRIFGVDELILDYRAQARTLHPKR